MQRDLLDALSTGWVEKALGVSRAAVSDWRRGKFPDRRQAELAAAVRALLPDTQESAPAWAEALGEDVPAIRAVVESNAVELAALRALLEATAGGLLPRGDDPVDDPPPQPLGRRLDQ